MKGQVWKQIQVCFVWVVQTKISNGSQFSFQKSYINDEFRMGRFNQWVITEHCQCSRQIIILTMVWNNLFECIYVFSMSTQRFIQQYLQNRRSILVSSLFRVQGGSCSNSFGDYFNSKIDKIIQHILNNKLKIEFENRNTKSVVILGRILEFSKSYKFCRQTWNILS